MSKLTKRVVDALRPDPTRDVFKWDAGDGALKGFGVRVKPSGVASYFVQYRNKEGRTRRLVLGRVGELTPHEARQLAADKLKEVRTGADPSAERHATRGAITVSELCDVYVADAEGASRRRRWRWIAVGLNAMSNHSSADARSERSRGVTSNVFSPT